MNVILRGSPLTLQTKSREELEEKIKLVEAAISSNTLKKSVRVNRGVFTGNADNPGLAKKFKNMKIGDEYEDRGFSSTTLGSLENTFLEDSEDTFPMVIDVPAGSNALFLDEFLSENFDELELLLPPGSRFRLREKKKGVLYMELVT